MAKLEADLKDNSEKLSTIKSESEKTLYTLSEMQVTLSEKNQQISAANNSIEDLQLKMTTLTETIEGFRAREETLTTELQNAKKLVDDAGASFNELKNSVELWAEHLVEAA